MQCRTWTVHSRESAQPGINPGLLIFAHIQFCHLHHRYLFNSVVELPVLALVFQKFRIIESGHNYQKCASKIKLKNVNQKRMATARRLIFFWNFSRHPLLIWLHYFFHHYKTLKAVATATAPIVLLTPANFYHFQRRKFNFQPLSFTSETLSKKLAETKNIARANVKKIKAKK